MKTFAYVRVSSKDQNEARQVETMKKEGVADRDVFIDKASGKNFERPQYQLLKQMVRKGDVVIFDSITRMGRNMDDTMKEYRWFVENGVQLRFLKEPAINTGDGEDLIQKALQNAVLGLLAAFAEKERQEIRTRQAEGIAIAKAEGRHLGRPKATITPAFEEAYKLWRDGQITAVEAMEKAGMAKATFYRKVKEYEEAAK